MFGLGLLKGLTVTMRHFIESYVYDRRPWQKRYDEEWLRKHQAVEGKGMFTIQYPEQKRQVPEHFRFIPMLVYDKTPDEPRCTACGICARVCPPQCIWIQRGTDEKGRPKAQPAGFWIDAVICMNCGSCAEYCPFDAIKMNQVHEVCTTDRDRDLYYDLQKLLVPVEYYARLHPSDYAAEEEERRAKEDAKRQAAATKQAPAPEPKPVVREAAVVVAAAAPSEPDDLKRIEGIGPKIAAVLQAAGILSFGQLAATKADQIKQILQEADPKLASLADPATWPQQARLAAGGKWDALAWYQERLKAGQDK